MSKIPSLYSWYAIWYFLVHHLVRKRVNLVRFRLGPGTLVKSAAATLRSGPRPRLPWSVKPTSHPSRYACDSWRRLRCSGTPGPWSARGPAAAAARVAPAQAPATPRPWLGRDRAGRQCSSRTDRLQQGEGTGGTRSCAVGGQLPGRRHRDVPEPTYKEDRPRRTDWRRPRR